MIQQAAHSLLFWQDLVLILRTSTCVAGRMANVHIEKHFKKSLKFMLTSSWSLSHISTAYVIDLLTITPWKEKITHCQRLKATETRLVYLPKYSNMAAFYIPHCNSTVAGCCKYQQPLWASKQLNAIDDVGMWLELFDKGWHKGNKMKGLTLSITCKPSTKRWRHSYTEDFFSIQWSFHVCNKEYLWKISSCSVWPGTLIAMLNVFLAETKRLVRLNTNYFFTSIITIYLPEELTGLI